MASPKDFEAFAGNGCVLQARRRTSAPAACLFQWRDSGMELAMFVRRHEGCQLQGPSLATLSPMSRYVKPHPRIYPGLCLLKMSAASGCSSSSRDVTPNSHELPAGCPDTAVGHHVKNVPPAVACPRCDDRNCTTTFHIPNGIKFE